LLPTPPPAPRALSLRGLTSVGRYAAPIAQLERLDELLRGAARQGGGVLFSDQAREELGWSEGEARAVLRALGFAPVGPAPSSVWRRKAEPARETKAAGVGPGASPFAALATLKPAKRRRRPARRMHG
jgi:ATP-dependent RNA helicase SUPV3L1/SUV3